MKIVSAVSGLKSTVSSAGRKCSASLVTSFSLLTHLASAEVLSNDLVRADFGASGLTNITDKITGRNYPFSQDGFAVLVDSVGFTNTSFTPVVEQFSTTNLVYCFTSGAWIIRTVYELEPGWRFLSKQVTVTVTNQSSFTVHSLDVMRGNLGTALAEAQVISGGQLLRFGSPVSYGLFLQIQNPFLAWTLNGRQFSAGYVPEMAWWLTNGPFGSDRLLLGVYAMSGVRYPASMVGEWQYVPDGIPPTGATLDAAEVDAVAECVRAFLLWRPTRSARVHVGWCENDYQVDISTAAGRTIYKRILDQAAAVGCDHELFTPMNSAVSSTALNTDDWGWEDLLWLNLGQKIRLGQWNPATDPIPSSLQEMLTYAQGKPIRLLAYSYPSLQWTNNPAWCNWGNGNRADTGQRSFQDWFLGKLSDFQNKTGSDGYSFDHWWIAFGSPPCPSSAYAQWYGCRRILENLRHQFPNSIIDGRQQYQWFGAWTWLAGSYPHPLSNDEQPGSFRAFPDLHWSRVSADRQRYTAWWYRMQNFAPPEILPGYMTHQTQRTSPTAGYPDRGLFRPRDWDYLGWRYSVISAVGTAPFNLIVNFLPARDLSEFTNFPAVDQQWFRDWFNWCDTNAPALRNLKPIINQPQVGRVDGTAAFKDGHGFIFLFNPNYRPLTAQFTLDKSISLTNTGAFVLRQLYPDGEKGRLFAPPSGIFWPAGSAVALPMPGADALVLEVTAAQEPTNDPVLLGAPGAVTLDRGVLALTNVAGEIGTQASLNVAVPAGSTVSSVSVNGVPASFQRTGDLISLSVRFSGAPFQRRQQIGTYDPAFAGGKYSAQITIPARVFQQLAARKAAWPIPYTADDLLATHLGSYRLLLFVNVADPNTGQSVSLKIDGQAATLQPGYTDIYGQAGNQTFTGWYADVSSLAPDVPHLFELTLPTLAAGQFQGLFLDNVEPEYTTSIETLGAASDDFNTPHSYLTNGLAGTIWEGIYTGAGQIPGGDSGSNGTGSTLTCDAGISTPGLLTVRSAQTDWQDASDDGFFLYKIVAGDFSASVHIDAFTNTLYSSAGLMARVADLASAAPGEDYVAWFRFDESGIANLRRSVDNNITADQWPTNFPNTNYWLMLQRVASPTNDTFLFYEKSKVSDLWSALPELTISRTDTVGLPLQVGLMQACSSTNSAGVQFDDFRLDTPGEVADSSPVPAQGLNVAPSGSNYAILSWTPSPGSSGTLALMRAGPITRQPTDGVTYTGSSTFGAGQDLGDGNFVVYVGTGSTVTVSGLAPGAAYSIALYPFSGAGAAVNYTLAAPLQGSYTVRVLQSISLSVPSSLHVGDGAVATVTANYLPSGQDDVSASAVLVSSNTNSVTVLAGSRVWAAAAGTATLIASYSGLSATQQVSVVSLPRISDAFNRSQDCLANGIVGTIWHGIYTRAGDVAGGAIGAAAGNTLACDANVSHSGRLTVQSTQTDWEYANDDGFLVWRMVSGDFRAQVQVPQYDVVAYNCAGLMARAASLSDAGAGEDYVAFFRFDEYGIANYRRSVDNNSTLNSPFTSQPGNPDLLLERVGNTFNVYERATLFDPWNPLPDLSVTRSDLAGLPLQVGLMQACFSGNTPTSQFSDFVLEGTGVDSSAEPAPVTGLSAIPVSPGIVQVSWTPAPGSTGSLVIMRTNGPITRQPVDGTTYIANARFGAGQSLGQANYAVYVGSDNTVTVSNLPVGPTSMVAVYSYTGSGSSVDYRIESAAWTWITPTVSIQLATDSVVLRWPTGASGFGLQSSGALAPAANWQAVNITPVVENGTNKVTVPLSGSAMFYRLAR